MINAEYKSKGGCSPPATCGYGSDLLYNGNEYAYILEKLSELP